MLTLNVRSGTSALLDAAAAAGVGVIRFADWAERGVLRVGEGFSYALYDIYSLEGFEKWTKAAIANCRLLSLLPGVKGVFDELLKTLEGQKDLYYATMFLNSLADCVGTVEEHGVKRKVLQLPRRGDGVDFVKVLQSAGNFFETGKFLQRYQVMEFPRWTAAGNALASLKLFEYGGWKVRFDDLPVFHTLDKTPKDFCIFTASCLDLRRCYREGPSPGGEIEYYCKVVGNIGKIALISFSRSCGGQVWFRCVDALTQNSAFVSHLVKGHKGRTRFFGSR